MRDYMFMMLMLALVALACLRPFVGVLLWSWISFMSVHRLGWGVATNLPWAMMSFAAIIVGCLVAREPKGFRPNLLHLLLVLFAIGMTVTSFFALNTPEAVWPKWEKVLKIILGLLVTAALLTERWRVHALVWMIVISIGYFGVRGGLFTVLTGGAHIVLGPPDSMIADRNHVAVAMLFAIPLMNWLRLQSPHRIVRIGLILAMVATLFGAIGTQSRGALVAMAGVAFLLWLRTPGKLVSGIAIAGAVAAVLAFMPASWSERMRTIDDFAEDASATGRIKIWRVSFDIAKSRPLIGGGFRAMYSQDIVDRFDPTVRARAAHSIYFEALGEHGFIVFGIWLAIIATGVLYSFRLIALARDRPGLRWAGDLGRMSQVSIVAYLAGGAFLSLAYWDVFWTLLIVLGAAYALAQREAEQGRAEAVAAPARPASRPAGGWRGRPVPARTAP